jgi:hypothetical protein
MKIVIAIIGGDKNSSACPAIVQSTPDLFECMGSMGGAFLVFLNQRPRVKLFYTKRSSYDLRIQTYQALSDYSSD